LRTVPAISFVAASDESGRIRTRTEVSVLACCEIGTNAAAVIFSQRKILSTRHDAHDLDRLQEAVLEIATDGIVRVEEAPCKLPDSLRQPPESSKCRQS
jgi:hypothetical protein